MHPNQAPLRYGLFAIARGTQEVESHPERMSDLLRVVFEVSWTTLLYDRREPSNYSYMIKSGSIG